jgi:hypothetical protein
LEKAINTKNDCKKANVKDDIGVETIGEIVAHYPRLLAYFFAANQISSIQR